MNKLLVAFSFFLFLSISSCTDEYTCVCTDTFNNQILSSTTIEARSSADAQEECDNKESPFYPDRCEIK